MGPCLSYDRPARGRKREGPNRNSRFIPDYGSWWGGELTCPSHHHELDPDCLTTRTAWDVKQPPSWNSASCVSLATAQVVSSLCLEGKLMLLFSFGSIISLLLVLLMGHLKNKPWSFCGVLLPCLWGRDCSIYGSMRNFAELY